MNRMLLSACMAAFLALTTGCATPLQPACPSGQQAMRNELLYFGTDIPGGGGIVTAQDWQGFLNDTVTPRFPQGLSVWQADGQWKSNAGPIVKERAYVLSIAHTGTVVEEQAVQHIAQTYKKRFRQEAVFRVSNPVCVSF